MGEESRVILSVDEDKDHWNMSRQDAFSQGRNRSGARSRPLRETRSRKPNKRLAAEMEDQPLAANKLESTQAPKLLCWQ